MTEEWSDWRFPEEDEDQPYFHCGECEENYKTGGHRHADAVR